MAAFPPRDLEATKPPQEATIKLLWHSNAPWSSTGYGIQTRLFLPRLKDAEWGIGCSAFYGLEGSVLPWNGIPIYPGFANTYGNETIREHAQVHFDGDLRGGLVASLLDVWVLDPPTWRDLNTCCWVPIDHEPLPPPIESFFRGSTAVPIAMSRFGERQLEEAGLAPLYMPHGVDTSIYRPIKKDEAREATGIPQEAAVFGVVAANKGNPSRKCFAEIFQAFKAFSDNYDDALLYLHTEALGRFDGVHLADLMRSVGLSSDKVIFADQYRVTHYPFSAGTMAQVYSSMDCLIAISQGEGFGIPTIEAQACGVPVIVSDFSASPELVGAGWKVAGRKEYTPLKAWQFHPDVEDTIQALVECYSLPAAERETFGRAARVFVADYDADRVFEEYMQPALKAAAERFEEREPVAV